MKFHLNKSPGSKFKEKDKEYLYFGGTSYLGLQTHADFQQGLIQNIKKLGTNWGSSRVSNVQLSIFDRFESYISSQAAMEDAICVSSGFLAGQILAGYFSQKGSRLLGAPNSHPAIIHQQSNIFSSYESLGKVLEKFSNNGGGESVLFLDSIDFTGGNYPGFENLRKLDLENIVLVVDDSHGFGVIGENGFGLYEKLNNMNCREIILCGSLGKACATPCGVILGEASRIKDLRATDYYAGGSPPSPAALKTFIDTEKLRISSLQKLRRNIKIFKNHICSGFPENLLGDHPVFGYNDEALTRHLMGNNIITTNFRYPRESSPLVSKIVLSASHSEDEILKLCKSINAYLLKIS